MKDISFKSIAPHKDHLYAKTEPDQFVNIEWKCTKVYRVAALVAVVALAAALDNSSDANGGNALLAVGRC